MAVSKFAEVKPQFNEAGLLKDGAFINGEWIKSAEEFFDVTDPANGNVIATLPDQGAESTRQAIEAAHAAFKSYKRLNPGKRAELLRRLHDLMLENADDLAKLVIWENGKSRRDATGEVAFAASYFDWFAGEATRTYGHTIRPGNSNSKAYTLVEPIGVCAIVCPWNFPINMIGRKISAALAVGCTVVIKPDAQTPLSALAMAALTEKAGFPPGVVNVVLTSKYTKEVGLALTESKLVKKVSFTGSTAVGKTLMRQSADTLKKLTLELGGNAPFIVCEDADVDLSVEQAIASKFRGYGQTCVCANRFYVHRSLIDEVSQKIAEKVKSFKLGHCLQDGFDFGPLINERAVEKVDRHATDAIERGGKVLVRGGRVPELGPNFYAPTVITHADPKSLFCSEETFGPFVGIVPFDTLEEVAKYANDTPFGLAGYIMSRSMNTLQQLSDALDIGMISFNAGLFSDARVPFGGVKESGFGVEGSLYGTEGYTVLKTITVGSLPDPLEI